MYMYDQSIDPLRLIFSNAMPSWSWCLSRSWPVLVKQVGYWHPSDTYTLKVSKTHAIQQIT